MNPSLFHSPLQHLLRSTVLPAFALAVSVATLSLHSLHAEELAADDPRANIIILDETAVQNLKIKTETAKERRFEKTVFAIGRLEEIPASRSVLSSRIPGRVVDIRVFEGDAVEKDQVLARVESRQPGNPPPTIDLKAPQAGLVVASHVRLGQPVMPENELLDISDRSVLWAVAKIPETEFASLVPGSLARIHIPALGDRVIEAKLLKYGIEADRKAGAIEGIFELPNPDGSLQIGMRAEFSIVAAERAGVLCIPVSAVQGDPSRRVVYVKDFELPNSYLPAPVVLGEENDRFVEVISGLFPSDEVVTQGSYSLGFAGSGSGMSLKEALDAAHGHEHNEDGSELTEAQKQEKKQQAKEAQGGSGPRTLEIPNQPLLIYAGVMTIFSLLFLQLLWNQRRKSQLGSAASTDQATSTDPAVSTDPAAIKATEMATANPTETPQESPDA